MQYRPNKARSIRTRAPKASSAHVRQIMQSIRTQDTQPEIALRLALHRLGHRYRKDTRPETSLRCKADIVFRKLKICVFVDGCFWHGCPTHFRMPKTNSDWWIEKIDDNRARDIRQAERLRKAGWIVVRIWEHQINDNLDEVVHSLHASIINRKISMRTCH